MLQKSKYRICVCKAIVSLRDFAPKTHGAIIACIFFKPKGNVLAVGHSLLPGEEL